MLDVSANVNANVTVKMRSQLTVDGRMAVHPLTYFAKKEAEKA